MSDERQLYGLAEREHSAGYSPLPLANPLPREEFDDTSAPAPDDRYRPISPSEAAEAPADSRNRPVLPDETPPAEPPPVVRDYSWVGGEHAGEPMDPRQTVSSEQAAFDLANQREAEALAAKNAADAELQQVLDQLKAGDQQPAPDQVAASQQPEPPVQPQAEQTPESRVAEALKDPAVLNAVREEVGRYEQQAAQAKQAWESAAKNNAELLIANLAARHPELRIGFEHWPTVLTNLAASNPQRAQQITSELQSTRQIFEQALQAEQNRTQQQQQQMHQYAETARKNFQIAARTADADFDGWCKSEGITDSQLADLKKEALVMLRETGMTDEQISAEYNSNWMLRNAGAQRILADAARYRLSLRNLSRKVSHPVPPSQHPGGGRSDFADARDYNTRDLSNKLSHTGSIRDAAALLNARRSRGR
jgi:hypothetical protein